MTEYGITASQTVGPFLKIGLVGEGQEYVVPKNTNGALKVQGRVHDGEGKPVPDAMIEIWQANVYGKYNHPEDFSDAELEKDFYGFGRSCTDEDGYFFFVTVKPGRVAGRGNTLQAPHLAVNVFARGMLKQQVTRIYFSDEKQTNLEDPVLNSIEDETVRETLIASRGGDEDGLPLYTFNIVLQGENETAFFDV
jgi:protocatechuate 3,4-dioxygenase alpha subunit